VVDGKNDELQISLSQWRTSPGFLSDWAS